MSKIMFAKCSNTNIGLKNIQFRESLPETTISFHFGTIEAEKAVVASWRHQLVLCDTLILRFTDRIA